MKAKLKAWAVLSVLALIAVAALAGRSDKYRAQHPPSDVPTVTVVHTVTAVPRGGRLIITP